MQKIPTNQIDTSNFNKYKMEELAKANKLAADISQFVPASAYGVFSISEGSSYFEYFQVTVDHPYLSIWVRFDGKKYYFYCESWNRIKFMDSYAIGAARQLTGEAPVTPGVLNFKKITAWVAYYEMMDGYIKAEAAKRAEIVDAFITRMDRVPHSFRKDNKMAGNIEANKMRYSYKIDEQNGYISESVSYTGSNNFDAFLESILWQGRY